MFFNKFACCSVPYFNLFLYFIEEGLALALNSLGFTHLIEIITIKCPKPILRVTILKHQKKKKKRMSNN